MKILTFSTLFPNQLAPNHGIFVQQRLKQLLSFSADIEARVMAPVPWFPFSNPRFGQYSRYSGVPAVEHLLGVQINHPRYLVLPKVGMSVAPTLLYLGARARVAHLINTGYDFDLIDAHYYYPDGVAAVMLGRKFNKPVVITGRGTDINLFPKYALPRKQILWAAEHARHSITVSAALRDRLSSLGADCSRIDVLRNGVDCEFFKPSPNRKESRDALDLQGITLLSVGNLIELKGHHLVIQALANLPDEVNLLIVGGGPMETELRELVVKLGLQSRVRFDGLLPQDELVKRYAAADCLVLASSREGLPNVVLEAMASGTPVIATDAGGIPEVVDNSVGYLLTERSIEAITTAVMNIKDRLPSRESVRQHAERFNWTETSRGQQQLFTRIIEEKNQA